VAEERNYHSADERWLRRRVGCSGTEAVEQSYDLAVASRDFHTKSPRRAPVSVARPGLSVPAYRLPMRRSCRLLFGQSLPLPSRAAVGVRPQTEIRR
jgi:hypothetical protein